MAKMLRREVMSGDYWFKRLGIAVLSWHTKRMKLGTTVFHQERTGTKLLLLDIGGQGF